MKILKFFIVCIFCFSQTAAADADEVKMAKGLQIFNETAVCASCHVLKAANSVGNVGPNLDTLNVTLQSVINTVTEGIGVMPAFGDTGILTNEEIETVAYFVINSIGK
jgi:cytochrome c6